MHIRPNVGGAPLQNGALLATGPKLSLMVFECFKRNQEQVGKIRQ
jgi:hypothetical protein